MSKVFITVGVSCFLLFTTRFASADDTTPRSPEVAGLLSVGGTALSAGLFAAGLHFNNNTLAGAGLLSSLVTPSAGQIYAGTPFTWGMGIRLVSAGLVFAGTSGIDECLADRGNHCHSNPLSGLALVGVGALGYAGGIIYDVATASTAAKNYNKRHHLQVTPIVAPTTASAVVGVGISGSF